MEKKKPKEMDRWKKRRGGDVVGGDKMAGTPLVDHKKDCAFLRLFLVA